MNLGTECELLVDGISLWDFDHRGDVNVEINNCANIA